MRNTVKNASSFFLLKKYSWCNSLNFCRQKSLNYARKHGGVWREYVSAAGTEERVQFLTAEIKVVKGEECENTSTAELQ
jgi:hypothetical protein